MGEQKIRRALAYYIAPLGFVAAGINFAHDDYKFFAINLIAAVWLMSGLKCPHILEQYKAGKK